VAAAVVAAIGGVGWCLVTRRHWAFRITSLLPLGVFALLASARVQNIYLYMPPWGLDERAPMGAVNYVPHTMEELKNLDQPLLTVLSVTRGIDEQTHQPILNVIFQNVSSNVRVTDWKADIIEFDANGKALKTFSPVNREPLTAGPGETRQLTVSGAMENVSKAKVVFEKANYQLLNPDGKEKENGSGVWENSHLQEDLAKAQQP
jgi:hypothetical protein